MPLPRENGYEFLFVQYMNKAFHFTPLLAYQVHKENAPECLRLISYADLQGSKDLVLMRGEFDKNLLVSFNNYILIVRSNQFDNLLLKINWGCICFRVPKMLISLLYKLISTMAKHPNLEESYWKSFQIHQTLFNIWI